LFLKTFHSKEQLIKYNGADFYTFRRLPTVKTLQTPLKN